MSEIDITKCGFYHPEHGKECHIALAFADEYTDADHTYLLCEQNPNCYYKQLQQLRTENEKLKKGVMLKCPQCGEIYLDSVACEVYEKCMSTSIALMKLRTSSKSIARYLLILLCI